MSIASTFFKSIKISTEPKEEFIDSRLRYNNPTDEVLQEAQNIYKLGLPISCIVSHKCGTSQYNYIMQATYVPEVGSNGFDEDT